MNDIASIYSTSLQGGEMPYFVGRQYGSGWLKALGRFAFPILKRFGKAAYNVASDYFGKSKALLPSLKEHALSAAGEFIPSLIPSGSGAPTRKRPPTGNPINKRRKMGIFKK